MYTCMHHYSCPSTWEEMQDIRIIIQASPLTVHNSRKSLDTHAKWLTRKGNVRMDALLTRGPDAYPIVFPRQRRTITISPGAVVCKEAEIVGDVTIGEYFFSAHMVG